MLGQKTDRTDTAAHATLRMAEERHGRRRRREGPERATGAPRCHFGGPGAMPDDPAQPTGRLLLTSTRAVFAGGARTPALPWHATKEIVQSGRDLIFVFQRTGEDDGVRFR